MHASYKKYIAACKKTRTTRRTWYIINKKYKQNMINQLEHIDAINQHRIAAEQEIISCYDFYIKKPQYKKAAAKIATDTKY